MLAPAWADPLGDNTAARFSNSGEQELALNLLTSSRGAKTITRLSPLNDSCQPRRQELQRVPVSKEKTQDGEAWVGGRTRWK